MARNDHALHNWMFQKLERRHALPAKALRSAQSEAYLALGGIPRMCEKPQRACQPTTHTASARIVDDSASDEHRRAVRLDPELWQLNVIIPDKPRSARRRYLKTVERPELVKQDRSKTNRK